MRAFQRDTARALSAEFEPEEASVVAELAGQVAVLVQNRESNAEDPALRRLLPDAYRDDSDAAAEFRRMTADDLSDRKVENANVLIATLHDATQATDTSTVTLDEEQALAWLRGITDIRLSLASRLGITGDELDDEDAEPVEPGVFDVYDWLAFVQDSLIRALEA